MGSNKKNGRRRPLGATGPRTEMGKRRSSMNALKYGYSACSLCVDTKYFRESPAQFGKLVRALLGEFPAPTESLRLKVLQYAVTRWRLARIERIEVILVAACLGDSKCEYVSSTGRLMAETVYHKAVMFNLEPEQEARKRLESILRQVEEEEEQEREKGRMRSSQVETPQQTAGKMLQLLAGLEPLYRCEAHLRRVLSRLEEELHRTFGRVPRVDPDARGNCEEGPKDMGPF